MRREHAILEKRVINFDNGGQPLVCCWDECDKLGTQLYKHTACEHDVINQSCERADRVAVYHSGRTAHTIYVFCSERHRAYWVNATGKNALESIARTGRAYGNLPVGMRGRLG